MRKKVMLQGFHLLVLSLIGFGAAQAQSDKIRQALEDGNAKRALSLALSSGEDSEFKKDPEVYFLKAQAIYELMKDPFYLKKYPESLKEGLKALEKGKSRADGAIFPEFTELADKYVGLNDMDALNDYKINRYSQAISKYMYSYSLNGNKISYFNAGKCWLAAADSGEGERIYREIIHWCNEQYAMNKKIDPQLSETYKYFGDKYWEEQKFDSADVVLIAARNIFGGDPVLDYYQREIAKQRIALLPPSSLMMDVIKKTLAYFPTDSFFVKKENALSLHLMRNQLANGELQRLDTTLAAFAQQKVDRNNSKDAALFREMDQFIDSKTENVLWKLVAYYAKYGHAEAANYAADKYIRQTAAKDTLPEIKKRYLVIIDYAAKTKSLHLANLLLSHGMSEYGVDPEFTAIQNSLISQNLKKKLDTDDQGALYEMMFRKEPVLATMSEDFQLITINYIDALVRDKQYVRAKNVIKTHMNGQADNPVWDKKRIVLAKEDFFYSYYSTRVKDEEVAGMLIPGFEWNGDPLQCNEGVLKSDIQQKVETRLNYFRRQAGLSEIYLDAQLNQWCQKAALMMETNKMMNHNPKANWSCYSDEGAEACKYSLLTKGANTTMAVTSFFADNNNPSVGNRRWLLYPNSKALGHGSSTNYCALWALDDSGNVDSNLHKETFVAWPPEGVIPKMMVFDYWSFSINQDLTGAKVTMSESGNPINLEMQPTMKGYGLPTLVWKPIQEVNTLPTDQEVAITIILRNGRKYTYKVYMMNFDAVGY